MDKYQKEVDAEINRWRALSPSRPDKPHITALLAPWVMDVLTASLEDLPEFLSNEENEVRQLAEWRLYALTPTLSSYPCRKND